MTPDLRIFAAAATAERLRAELLSIQEHPLYADLAAKNAVWYADLLKDNGYGAMAGAVIDLYPAPWQHAIDLAGRREPTIEF